MENEKNLLKLKLILELLKKNNKVSKFKNKSSCNYQTAGKHHNF